MTLVFVWAQPKAFHFDCIATQLKFIKSSRDKHTFSTCRLAFSILFEFTYHLNDDDWTYCWHEHRGIRRNNCLHFHLFVQFVYATLLKCQKWYQLPSSDPIWRIRFASRSNFGILADGLPTDDWHRELAQRNAVCIWPDWKMGFSVHRSL